MSGVKLEQKIKILNDSNFEGYQFEALDRTHLVLAIIDEHLIDHPFIDENEDIKRLFEDASDLMATAYQLIGAKGEK